MEYLTTGQIAEFLSLTPRTIQRYINNGVLKAHKLPGRGNNRVSVQDFANFCEDHAVPCPEQVEALLEKPKVLVIEDDLEMLKSMGRIIRQSNWEPILAADGFQAGKLLHEHCPSVMTLDVNIPGINGLDILKFTREQPGFSHIKIIIVSGSANQYLHTAIIDGADAIVQKPFKNEVLIKTISDLLEQ